MSLTGLTGSTGLTGTPENLFDVWAEELREDAGYWFSGIGYGSCFSAWIEPIVEKPRPFGIFNWADWDVVDEIKSSDYGKIYGTPAYEDEDCCSVDNTPLWLAVRQMNSLVFRKDKPAYLPGGRGRWPFPEWLPIDYQPFYAEWQFSDVGGHNYGFTDFPLQDGLKPSMSGRVKGVKPQPIGFYCLEDLPSNRESYPLMDSLLKFDEHKAKKEGKSPHYFKSHYGIESDLWVLEGAAGGEIRKVDYVVDEVCDYPNTSTVNTSTRPAVRLLLLDGDKKLLPRQETLWMFHAGVWFESKSAMVESDGVTPSWAGLMIKIFAPSEEAWDEWLGRLD